MPCCLWDGFWCTVQDKDLKSTFFSFQSSQLTILTTFLNHPHFPQLVTSTLSHIFYFSLTSPRMRRRRALLFPSCTSRFGTEDKWAGNLSKSHNWRLLLHRPLVRSTQTAGSSRHKQTLLTTLKIIRIPANCHSLIRIPLIIRFRELKRQSQSAADTTYNWEVAGLKIVTNKP